MLTRREFVKKTAALCTVTGAVAKHNEALGTTKTPPGEHHNVLLLIGDDHGLSHLGCYGNSVIKTPNLDYLAQEGVRFTNAFTTVASCSPSRSTIYTGLFTHTNGQYGLQHATHNQQTFRWVKSVSSILNKQGYHTGVIGKVHVQPEEIYPFQEVISEGLKGNRDVWTMAEKAWEFFSAYPEKPFFLVMGYSDPHRDWISSNKVIYPNVQKIKYNPDDVIVPPFLPDMPEVRQELADCYESVSRLDQGIGFILDNLRKSSRDKNTLIIYVSDNGIPFPGAKTTLYDAGIHLPMIISAPSLKKRGGVNNAMVSFIDIVPTILDWTDSPAPYELPGHSLLPILEEENPSGWDTIYASHQFHEITMYYPMRAIRTRKYKYILNIAYKLDFPFASDLYNSQTWQGILQRKDVKMGVKDVETYVHRPKEELFDLETDPNETNNVANDTRYKDILNDLRKRLREFQERTKDQWILKYKYE